MLSLCTLTMRNVRIIHFLVFFGTFKFNGASQFIKEEVNCTSDINLSCSSECYNKFEPFKWCQCDVHCTRYEDCCSDFEKLCFKNTNESLIQELSPSNSTIYPVPCSNNMRYIDSCLQETDNSTKLKCEQLEFDYYDEATIVTDMSTGVVYRNYHCAVCNSANLKSLALWDITAECNLELPTVQKENDIFQAMYVAFNSCKIIFTPEHLSWPRPCINNYNTDSSYQEPVLGLLKGSITIFKNAMEAAFVKADTSNIEHNCITNPHFNSIHYMPKNYVEFENDTFNYTLIFRRDNSLLFLGTNQLRFPSSQACNALYMRDICYNLQVPPTCGLYAAMDIFNTFDKDSIRTPDEMCIMDSSFSQNLVFFIYLFGYIISAICYGFVLYNRAAAHKLDSGSSLISNSLVLFLFLFFNCILHLFRFIGYCKPLGPFLHFLQVCIMLWVFVIGCDIGLDRKDAVPQIAFMMLAWVYPVIVLILISLFHYKNFIFENFLGTTYICWQLPLWFEIPEYLMPFFANIYALSLVLTSSETQAGANIPIALFPIVFLNWLLNTIASYLAVEIFQLIVMMIDAYLGLIITPIFMMLVPDISSQRSDFQERNIQARFR